MPADKSTNCRHIPKKKYLLKKVPNLGTFVYLQCESYCKKHFTEFLDQAQGLRRAVKILV